MPSNRKGILPALITRRSPELSAWKICQERFSDIMFFLRLIVKLGCFSDGKMAGVRGGCWVEWCGRSESGGGGSACPILSTSQSFELVD